MQKLWPRVFVDVKQYIELSIVVFPWNVHMKWTYAMWHKHAFHFNSINDIKTT